jgi:hypothetical protein
LGFALCLVAAHASLDEYVANWFGLDQSKYQWALNDYYEATGKVSDSTSAKQLVHSPFGFGWNGGRSGSLHFLTQISLLIWICSFNVILFVR